MGQEFCTGNTLIIFKGIGVFASCGLIVDTFLVITTFAGEQDCRQTTVGNRVLC